MKISIKNRIRNTLRRFVRKGGNGASSLRSAKNRSSSRKHKSAPNNTTHMKHDMNPLHFYPLKSELTKNVMTSAMYYQMFDEKHPNVAIHKIVDDNKFFESMYSLFQSLTGKKLNKDKFSYLFLAFLKCTSESKVSFADFYTMWPGLKEAVGPGFDKEFTEFAANVAEGLFSEFQQSNHIYKSSGVKSKKSSSSSSPSPSSSSSSSSKSPSSASRSRNNTRSPKKGGALPTGSFFDSLLEIVFIYLVSRFLPNSRRRGLFLVLAWLFFFWGLLNIYNSVESLLFGNIIRDSVREVIPDLGASFRGVGSSAMALIPSSAHPRMVAEMAPFEASVRNLQDGFDEFARRETFTNSLSLWRLLTGNPLEYFRANSQLREFMMEFQNTPAYGDIRTHITRAMDNMVQSFDAIISHSPVIHAPAAEDDASFWGGVQRVMAPLRNVVAQVGNVLHTASRSNEIITHSRDSATREFAELIQRISSDFLRMVRLASTRLDTRISRDVWGIRWGIPMVLLNGGYLTRFYYALYQARRRATARAQAAHDSRTDDNVSPGAVVVTTGSRARSLMNSRNSAADAFRDRMIENGNAVSPRSSPPNPDSDQPPGSM